MVWWLARPSHRTTITDSDTAVGIVLVVRMALNSTTFTDTDIAVGNVEVVRTALTAVQ